MEDYIAWLSGQSVAKGTLAEVQEKAQQIVQSDIWQMFEGPTATLKITRGPRQLLVKSIILRVV